MPPNVPRDLLDDITKIENLGNEVAFSHPRLKNKTADMGLGTMEHDIFDGLENLLGHRFDDDIKP